MRIAFISASLLASSAAIAATPINGWYAGVFGGYAYIPNNISITSANYSRIYSNTLYDSGYHAGGRFGYKSTPLRYEGEITYINADIKRFNINNARQRVIGGDSSALLAMANIYYDFPLWLSVFEPFIGVGLGYAWVDAHLTSRAPFGYTRFSASNNVFAYQATAGITYDFAENYALNIGYRYVGTQRAHNLGKVYQAHLASVGAVYRFDGSNYK